MTTPVGGGIRSLNVALRQELDLYVCLRPVQWFTGVPSPASMTSNSTPLKPIEAPRRIAPARVEPKICHASRLFATSDKVMYARSPTR